MSPPYTIICEPQTGLIITVSYEATFDVYDDLHQLSADLRRVLLDMAAKQQPGFQAVVIHDVSQLNFTLMDIRYGLLNGFAIEVDFGEHKPSAIHTMMVSQNRFLWQAIRTLWTLISALGVSFTLHTHLEEAIAEAKGLVKA